MNVLKKLQLKISNKFQQVRNAIDSRFTIRVSTIVVITLIIYFI